jgi:hypothetical protein
MRVKVSGKVETSPVPPRWGYAVDTRDLKGAGYERHPTSYLQDRPKRGTLELSSQESLIDNEEMGHQRLTTKDWQDI